MDPLHAPTNPSPERPPAGSRAGDPTPPLEQLLQARTAQLQAANKRQDAFLSGVSHDMRAPLRSIDGFAQQLGRRPAVLADTEAQEHLSRIQHAARRMGELIDRLQELTRAGRSDLRPSNVDVSLLAEWCMAELQDAQPNRQAVVAVQPGLQMTGDERLLKALLGQLLDNVWRFSAPRPEVWVEVTGERTEDGLRLSVRDHGIGFDMAYADKLFEPFQRLHGVDQGAGPGLGLAIAELIAQRHHGSIHAESEVDAGSVFHVELKDIPPGDVRQGTEVA